MEISRNWRLQKTRYNLSGEVCEDGHVTFPPQRKCPQCPKSIVGPYGLSGKGEIYSFTTVYESASQFKNQLPFTLALIKLAEGFLITAQITDSDNGQIKIGQEVEMVTRVSHINGDLDRGIIVYSYKFRPTL
jgi:uncharacterized protein